MVKQRMTTADVAGEVACLRQKLIGMRVANGEGRDGAFVHSRGRRHIMWTGYREKASS